MSALGIAWKKLGGLFVDDGRFAVAILVWVGACAGAIWLGLPPVATGVLLFGGLALLLAGNVWRAMAKQRGKPR